MNRPQRDPSRYGGGPAQGQSSFVDPATEGAAAARAFFPAPGGGEQSAASAAAMGAPRQQQHYGGGAEISLGHGHGHGHGWHRYHQFRVEAKDDVGGSGGPPGLLPRHSSSPPGFFSSLVVDNNVEEYQAAQEFFEKEYYEGFADYDVFSTRLPMGFSSSRAGVGGGGDQVRQAMNNKKMKSPLKFARQGTLPQISEDGIPDLTDNLHGAGQSEDNIAADHVVRSFSGGFSIGSWEDSNSIVFSSPTGKPGIHNNDDIIANLSNYESQFIMPREMAGADKYLQMQQDQVPFRVRAKRGCATHPRSIAERERRTRISEKLRTLQALVPNMDKQTSTADMLDLAVEHIKGLQSQLQALKEDKEKCTCRGKQASRN